MKREELGLLILGLLFIAIIIIGIADLVYACSIGKSFGGCIIGQSIGGGVVIRA